MHLRSDHSVTPDALDDILPSKPIWASPPGQAGDMIAQFYRHPPATVRFSELRAHGLAISMGGEALLSEKTARGRRQAWSRAGCFSLTPAGRPLDRSWQGRPEVLIALLDQALVASIVEDLELQGPSAELVPQLATEDPVLHDLGRVLLSTLSEASIASGLMMDALARAIGARLLQQHAASGEAPNALMPSLGSARLRRVIDYMSANVHRQIGLRDLAETCGLSRTHFGRAFKEASGQTPHRYLTELRVEKAKHLLESSSLSVADIAERCGFGQPQYLATVFQREVGLTPSAWRRERRL